MVRSYLETPVPNDIAYSPATIAQSISEGLYDNGHEVTFFGPDGTSVKTEIETCGMRPFFRNTQDFDSLVSTSDLFTNYMFGIADAAMARQMLERASRKEFDCVVFHHFESVLPLAKLYPTVPIVCILHDEMDEKRRAMIELGASTNIYFISISENQRRDIPDLNYAATIYNGIDTEAFAYEQEPNNYLMFSGRITQIKGVKEAVQVARQSKNRLLIAGNLSPSDYGYFDEHVKPYLDDQVLFLGMLGRDQLIKYYQRAKALLAPVQWQEPFGLTLIEANSCGTPVIAFNRGAIPEVIVDGKTGYVVDNSAEMIMAIEKISKINRKDCRDHVINNFSRELMVKRYETVLQEIIKTHGKHHRRLTEMSAKDISKGLQSFSKKLMKPPRQIKK